MGCCGYCGMFLRRISFEVGNSYCRGVPFDLGSDFRSWHTLMLRTPSPDSGAKDDSLSCI